MPTNYTQNYHLSQWEPGDKVLRTDFNADNAKIDGAIKAETDARTAAVASLAGQLGQKGNCQLYVSTYRGTGTFGEAHPTKHTFPGKPVFVIIGRGEQMLMAFQGQSYGLYSKGTNTGNTPTSWTGNTMSWYSSSAAFQFNTDNMTYNIMALIAADS